MVTEFLPLSSILPAFFGRYASALLLNNSGECINSVLNKGNLGWWCAEYGVIRKLAKKAVSNSLLLFS